MQLCPQHLPGTIFLNSKHLNMIDSQTDFFSPSHVKLDYFGILFAGQRVATAHSLTWKCWRLYHYFVKDSNNHIKSPKLNHRGFFFFVNLYSNKRLSACWCDSMKLGFCRVWDRRTSLWGLWSGGVVKGKFWRGDGEPDPGCFVTSRCHQHHGLWDKWSEERLESEASSSSLPPPDGHN